jgi:4-alpha-glucanotransferase
MYKRASGILLHVSSLPSQFGIGDLGPGAFAWIDFLVGARQSFWQILPVGPAARAGHNSPYQAASAFAGSPLYISPSALRDDGLLTDDELKSTAAAPEGRVDYEAAGAEKRRLLDAAYQRFRGGARRESFETFCGENSEWLDDFALFRAIEGRFPERCWFDWPPPLRDRDPEELEHQRRLLGEAIEREKFFQYEFFKQWFRLKKYANERGIQIIGDLPFYVGYDCADVWANPVLYKLDESKKRRFIAGVPPDAFSATGQLWDNPVYDWPAHARTRYSWWISRLRQNLGMFNLLRIDHFRGFAAYWEVPADHTTAVDGKWQDGPGNEFFDELLRHWPIPPLIAEDLGTITPDVRELMRRYSLPGMKVLLFAFDGDTATNPYSVHNHVRDSVLYTGTHDNNTVRGWFENEAGSELKERLRDYLGGDPTPATVHWDFVRLAMRSVSSIVITPMQDVLGLGGTARMNHPARVEGNWEWRLKPGEAAGELAEKLAHETRISGRV